MKWKLGEKGVGKDWRALLAFSVKKDLPIKHAAEKKDIIV